MARLPYRSVIKKLNGRIQEWKVAGASLKKYRSLLSSERWFAKRWQVKKMRCLFKK
jgi:hypothetical protein